MQRQTTEEEYANEENLPSYEEAIVGKDSSVQIIEMGFRKEAKKDEEEDVPPSFESSLHM